MILLYDDDTTSDCNNRSKTIHDEFYNDMINQMTVSDLLFQLRHVKPTINETTIIKRSKTTTKPIDKSIKIQNNGINIIKKALEYAAVLNNHNDTPLHLAAAYGNISCNTIYNFHW